MNINRRSFLKLAPAAAVVAAVPALAVGAIKATPQQFTISGTSVDFVIPEGTQELTIKMGSDGGIEASGYNDGIRKALKPGIDKWYGVK